MYSLARSECQNRVYPPGDDILVLPAELVAESADGAVLAARLETEDTESLGDDHALLVVVWGRDALKGLEALHGGGAASGLVRNHATDGAPEHLGWRTVVPWTTTGGVETSLLAEEGLVVHCIDPSVSLIVHLRRFLSLDWCAKTYAWRGRTLQRC